jgi:hypothetical protein
MERIVAEENYIWLERLQAGSGWLEKKDQQEILRRWRDAMRSPDDIVSLKKISKEEYSAMLEGMGVRVCQE